jgi:hypothetical protein
MEVNGTDVRDSTEETREAGHDQVHQQMKTTVTIEEVDPQGLTVTYRSKDNRKNHADRDRQAPPPAFAQAVG